MSSAQRKSFNDATVLPVVISASYHIRAIITTEHWHVGFADTHTPQNSADCKRGRSKKKSERGESDSARVRWQLGGSSPKPIARATVRGWGRVHAHHYQRRTCRDQPNYPPALRQSLAFDPPSTTIKMRISTNWVRSCLLAEAAKPSALTTPVTSHLNTLLCSVYDGAKWRS